MVRIELSSKRPEEIQKHLIFDDCPILGTADLPAAVIDLEYAQRATGTVFGANPVNVLRELADLVQRVPYWKLQLSFLRAFCQHDLHLDQVLVWIRQGDCVVCYGIGRRERDDRQQQATTNPAHRMTHRFPAAFAESSPRVSAARARNRAGSFS